jgi:hypothetical protein
MTEVFRFPFEVYCKVRTDLHCKRREREVPLLLGLVSIEFCCMHFELFVCYVFKD